MPHPYGLDARRSIVAPGSLSRVAKLARLRRYLRAGWYVSARFVVYVSLNTRPSTIMGVLPRAQIVDVRYLGLSRALSR